MKKKQKKTNEDMHKKNHNIHLLQFKINLDVIKKLETNSNNDTCYTTYVQLYVH